MLNGTWAAIGRARLVIGAAALAMLLALGGCGGSGGSMELPDDLQARAGEAGAGPSASKLDTPGPGELIAFPAVPLGGPDEAAGGNVLLNGGFEQRSETAPEDAPAVPQWTLEPEESVTARLSADQAAEGERSLRVDVSAGGRFAARQEVTGQGQYPHLLRALVLTQGLDGEVRLAVEGRKGEREVLSARSEGASGTTDAWRQLELTFESPAFLEGFDVLVEYAPASEESGGVFWVDRCELYRLPAPEGENLVRNGAFGEGPDDELWHWIWWENHDLALVPSELGAQFPRCLQVTLPGRRRLGIGQALRKASPGERYRVRAYMKCENLVGTAQIVLHSPKSAFRHAVGGLTGTEDWVWVEGEFEVPAGCDDLHLLLSREPEPDASEQTGTVWFANVEVLPISQGGGSDGGS